MAGKTKTGRAKKATKPSIAKPNHQSPSPSGRGLGPNPVDVYVGQRMRQRRVLLGLTQDGLAGLLGVTFQQIQKYERGTNRMSASRLYDVSHVLDIPIQWFFDNMDSDVESLSPRKRAGLAEAPQLELQGNVMQSRETLELVRSYYKIENPKARRKVADMCHELAKKD